jgi:hypothetical protein
MNGQKSRSAAALAVLALASCASGADPAKMAVRAPPQTAPYPSKLQSAMCVGTVTGGEETNPLWVSKVGNEDFRAALTNSMHEAGLIGAPNACAYPLDVHLLGLSQPAFAFNMTVESHVNYKVHDKAGTPVLLTTVNARFTAPFDDAILGVVRLKHANEGSIRENIRQFLTQLQAVTVP